MPKDIPVKPAADKEEQKKRLTVPEIIEQASDRSAEKVVAAQWRARNVNLYRSMERLLRLYKKYRYTAEHPDEFQFWPEGKSKDISVAPPPGSGMVDRLELTENYVRAKARAFEAQVISWHMADSVIRQFMDKPEFVIIRMFYFNEDANGQDRGDAKPYTFEDISEALAAAGIERSERTLRSWRTKLVQDMTVLLFGVDGAVSVEAREPKQGARSNEA